MKKSKFEKTINDIIDNHRKSLDLINELIQECNVDFPCTLNRLSSAFNELTNQIADLGVIKNENSSKSSEFASVYGFSNAFKIEESDSED